MTNQEDPEKRPRRYGRPPKPAGTVRSERVVSFFTPTELRGLEKISDRRGVFPSVVIHSLATSSLEESNGPA
jgi:hypothetical protein